MKSSTTALTTGFLVLLLGVSFAKADVCMMLYQMADNDLEYFIVNDLLELVQSPAIADPTLTTWVYHDGRNYDAADVALGYYVDDGSPVIADALPLIYDTDGNPLSSKITTSSYMTYNHDLDKMVVVATSQEELNGDDPQTVTNFVYTASLDCIERGSDEYMLFFSSHGSGALFGFGGDLNTGQRRLSQANAQIANAISVAINQAATETGAANAPTQLDVLGFDACLMQAFGALEDYHTLTKYYLASEAVEPGTGWSYFTLDKSDTAVNIALDLLNDFIDELQGYDDHQPPKTMALVETAKFPAFVDAWEALSAEMNDLFQNDANFNVFLRRSRSSAIAFEGSLDGSAGADPSALDIGSFMSSFRQLCSPEADSTLNTLLVEAETTYQEMFVAQRNGEGTPPATGMHILWPTKRVYQQDASTNAFILFDSDLAFEDGFAPNFRQFLQTYYEFNGSIDISSGSSSVCGQQSDPQQAPSADEYLLVSPQMEINCDRIDVTSNIVASTDEVVVEYGIDISHFLEDRIRLLKESLYDRRRSLGSFDRNTTSMIRNRFRHPLAVRSEAKYKRRNLQSNQDYFILFGGDLLGNFQLSSYQASWERNYYLVGDDNNAEFAYAFSYQGGYKQIPVFYFPESITVTKDDIFLGADISDAQALNGELGFLSFSVKDNGSVGSYVLYTFDDNDRLSETSKSAPGVIVPIVFTEAVLGGTLISVLVGGFSQAIIPWNEDTTLAVESFDAVEYLEALESNLAVVDVVAYDDDNVEDGIDFITFDVTLDELKGCGARDLPPGPTPTSTGVTPSRLFPIILVVTKIVAPSLFW